MVNGNKRSASRSSGWALLAVAGALALGSAALGQGVPIPGAPEEPRLKPPVPSVPRSEPSDILGIVFAIVLGGAVVGVNMIPGRRGHQD